MWCAQVKAMWVFMRLLTALRIDGLAIDGLAIHCFAYSFIVIVVAMPIWGYAIREMLDETCD